MLSVDYNIWRKGDQISHCKSLMIKKGKRPDQGKTVSETPYQVAMEANKKPSDGRTRPSDGR